MTLIFKSNVSKTTLKNNQCWISLRSEFGEHLGTIHIIIPEWAEEVAKCKQVTFEK